MRSQGEPGGARGSQEEPGGAMESQGEPGGARGARSAQNTHRWAYFVAKGTYDP